jgi:hypothetical protein
MKISQILIFFACCIAFISCYTPRYLYSPTAHNVPVFTQKGDNKLACYYSTNAVVSSSNDNSQSDGIDIQGAYAITKEFSIEAAYAYRKDRNGGVNNSLDSVDINYKRNLTEFGFGYYKDLTRHKRVYFEFFAGFAFGKLKLRDIGVTDYVYHDDYFNTLVTKYFVQPVIVLRHKDYFSQSFSSKLSIVRFSNINTNYSPTDLINYKLDSLQNHSNLFWEPASVTSFGFKRLPGFHLEFQLGFSFLNSSPHFNYRDTNISAGLVVDVQKLFAPAHL